MAIQNLFGDLANDKTITDLYNLMAFYLDRMEFGINTDNAKRLKVNLVDSGALANVTTVGTVANVTTVGTVADQTLVGGLQAKRTVEAQLDTAFNAGFLSKITF